MTEQSTQERLNYLQILFRYKIICFAVPIVLAAGAYVVAMFLPKWYSAETTVTVTRIDLGPAEMNLSDIPVKSLRSYFQSGELVRHVMERFGLGEEPYNISRYEFYADLLEVSSPRESETITIEVRLPAPNLAAEVANTIAARGVEAYNHEMRQQLVEMIDELTQQAEAAQTRLTAAETLLEQFQATSDINRIRSQIHVELERHPDRQERRDELALQLAAVTQLAESYRQSLAELPETVELRQRLADDGPAYQQMLARLADTSAEQLLELEMIATEPSPVHQRIQENYVEAMAHQQELAAGLAATDAEIAQGEANLTRLSTELALLERQERELDFARERAADAAELSLERLQRRRTVGLWPPRRMNAIFANVPDRAYWPKKTLVAVTTLLVSFAVMWIVAIAIENRRALRNG